MKRSLSDELDKLRRHLAEVEMELARYAHNYGLTDEARRLLNTSPLSGRRPTDVGPDDLN
jgi:hypothetical protein